MKVKYVSEEEIDLWDIIKMNKQQERLLMLMDFCTAEIWEH